MSTKTRYSDHTMEWEELIAALAANLADLPLLEPTRAVLEHLLQEVQRLTREQLANQARKQQASKDLKALISNGRKVATMAKAVIKQRYGHSSEKLVEFGIQPLRPRSRRAVPDEPEPAAPSEPASNPTE
jgi:hypothetical protein